MGSIIRNRVNMVRSAPNVSATIKALGGDPTVQVYDEGTGSYVPDRTVLPLTLQAEILSDGKDVSAEVTNQGWYLATETGESQITSTTAGYEIVNTVVPMRLKVKTNTPGGKATELIYRYTHNGIASAVSIPLTTEVNGAPAPELELDCASSVLWNPFEPATKDWMTIRPTVRAYNRTGLTVRWRKKDGATTRDIMWGDPKDIELRKDGDNLKVNRRWMGSKVSVVCELMEGTKVLRTCPVTQVRRIPKYEHRMLVSTIFSDTDSVVHARAEVKIGGKILDNPSAELLIIWYEGTTEVGRGNSHDYPCRGRDSVDVGMRILDSGPLYMLTEGTGAYLTDDAGVYLLAKVPVVPPL